MVVGEEELGVGERVTTMALDTPRLYVATSRNRLIVKLVDQPTDQSMVSKWRTTLSKLMKRKQ